MTDTGTNSERNWITAQALASGDFSESIKRFADIGVRTNMPDVGMLQLYSDRPPLMRVLLSVGVHGNETAPIDMLVRVLNNVMRTTIVLAVDLLIVVGNLDALASGVRFIETDLNRLFQVHPSNSDNGLEAIRARDIMRVTRQFFSAAPVSVDALHLDLHSAIRPSRYACFAVMPTMPADADQPNSVRLLRRLGDAGIEAVLFNGQQASTYSAFSANACGVSACTVELGQVAILGSTGPENLGVTQQALERLLQGQALDIDGKLPQRFFVAQEVIKRSDHFKLLIPADAQNFTAFAPGTVVASNGNDRVCVGRFTEYVVFPNPNVAVGQRAALMATAERSPL